MKIIKQPKFNPCTCVRCGTIFLPEAGDEIFNRNFLYMATECPTCRNYCQVTIEEERSGQPETCVSCGAIIPEGRQVCPNCEKGVNDVQKN